MRAAIFDLDETLVNLEPLHEEASRILCQRRGADYGAVPESTRNRSGTRIIDDVDELRGRFGWAEPLESLYAERRGIFLQLIRASEIPLLPGAREAVLRCAGLGLELALVTSGSADAAEEILTASGLRASFRVLVTGEEVTVGKPDPAPYLLALQRLKRAAAECIAFEDSEVGVRSANAAGILCVGVRHRDAREWQDLRSAALVIEGLAGLTPELLKQLVNRKAEDSGSG